MWCSSVVWCGIVSCIVVEGYNLGWGRGCSVGVVVWCRIVGLLWCCIMKCCGMGSVFFRNTFLGARDTFEKSAIK